MTRPRKIPIAQAGIKLRISGSGGGCLTTRLLRQWIEEMVQQNTRPVVCKSMGGCSRTRVLLCASPWVGAAEHASCCVQVHGWVQQNTRPVVCKSMGGCSRTHVLLCASPWVGAAEHTSCCVQVHGWVQQNTRPVVCKSMGGCNIWGLWLSQGCPHVSFCF